MQKASGAGQRIYHITQASQSSTLSNIHHDADTLNDIQVALATGKEVITHTDAVSVPGWSGAGYIIFDPITGDGAYKIGGGGNGSYGAMLLKGLLLWAAISAGFLGTSFSPLLLFAAAATILTLKLIQFLGDLDCSAQGPLAIFIFLGLTTALSTLLSSHPAVALGASILFSGYRFAIQGLSSAACKVAV